MEKAAPAVEIAPGFIGCLLSGALALGGGTPITLPSAPAIRPTCTAPSIVPTLQSLEFDGVLAGLPHDEPERRAVDLMRYNWSISVTGAGESTSIPISLPAVDPDLVRAILWWRHLRHKTTLAVSSTGTERRDSLTTRFDFGSISETSPTATTQRPEGASDGWQVLAISTSRSDSQTVYTSGRSYSPNSS